MTSRTYLVVAATRAEAAHVPPDLPVLVTGLGKTAAAVATAEALVARDRTGLTVVNVGTAGALRDGLTGLHLPTAVFNHDINADVIRGLGYDPQEWLPLPGGAGDDASVAASTAEDVVLASGDLFVTDPEVRRRLAERAHLVDMEGYAVAYACRRAGVPVRLVKHVSDAADESAFDWPSMVDASARVLGRWCADHLL